MLKTMFKTTTTKKMLLKTGPLIKKNPSRLSNNLTQMMNLKMKHNTKFLLVIAAKEILFSYVYTTW